MQNNSNYQYLLSKLLVLVLYSCHGNLSILQSVFCGLKGQQKLWNIANFCIISSYFSSCSVEVSFHFRNFLLQIIADSFWTWPSFFLFSFCCVLTWICVLSFLCLFRAFIFSVILSCTPATIWEWKIPCSVISLMLYCHLLILHYFSLSRGIGPS